MTTDKQTEKADAKRIAEGAAQAVLKKRKPKINTSPNRKAAFNPAKLTVTQKQAYAGALVATNNNTAAFIEVFGDAYPDIPTPTLHYYTNQLNDDPVVRDAVVELLRAKTEAYMSVAEDKRLMAIGVLAKLSNICRADHEELSVHLLGKSPDALRDLPGHLRGVISGIQAKEDKYGVWRISKITHHDPQRAAEVLAKWLMLAKGVEAGMGHSAEAVPIEIFESDGDRARREKREGANGARANGHANGAAANGASLNGGVHREISVTELE